MSRLQGPVILVLLALAGYLGFVLFSETEEDRIRERIASFQDAATFTAETGNILRMAKAESLPGYFTEDCEIVVAMKGVVRRTLYGRDSVRAAIGQIVRFRGNLEVKLNDLIVTVAESETEATVELTATVAYGPPDVLTAQQFMFEMKKIEDDWQVHRLRTVDTLRR